MECLELMCWVSSQRLGAKDLRGLCKTLKPNWFYGMEDALGVRFLEELANVLNPFNTYIIGLNCSCSLGLP